MTCSAIPNGILNHRYGLLGIIGHGQYGVAHKARCKADGQVVCLKRIPMQSQDDHKGALQEAQLLSSLDHPNIIAYKESFLDSEGALCIATTYCEGGDLFTKIKQRKADGCFFTENEAMDCFVQVASALLYIHSKKILHRDLKTQNIFLQANGIVMLGDFGICKVLEKTDAFATTVTGTPYYMAPEVCTNQPYTYQSDIWSLGCVLYEICTLTHAFAADSLLSLVYQIVRGSYPPVPVDMFSADMIDLIKQLLTQDPVQRPSLPRVLSMPYVQQHLQRFNTEEHSRMLHKQSSLDGTSRTRQHAPDLLVGGSTTAGMSSSGLDEGTMPAGLTPKQRLAWKKQEERRQRELELQVAGMNASKERQEVAKRKQSQLASSSLHGILQGPAHTYETLHSHSQKKPQNQQQQQQQPGDQSAVAEKSANIVSNKLAEHKRPATAGAADAVVAPSAGRVWPLNTHNSHVCGSSGASSSTSGSPSPSRSPLGSPEKAATGGAGGTAAVQTAYALYDERPVGLSSKKAQNFFINEDDDLVNIGTMPALALQQQQQQQQLPWQHVFAASASGACNRSSNVCELSLDSDSVLLGSVVQQQRPFSAPAADPHLQLLMGQSGSARVSGVKAAGNSMLACAAATHRPAAPAAEAAAAGIRPYRTTSDPSAASNSQAAAAATAGPFKFGLNTAERRAYSSNGGSSSNGAKPAGGMLLAPRCGSAGGSCCNSSAGCNSENGSGRSSNGSPVRHSPLSMARGAVVRFGVRAESEPLGAFDLVLGGGPDEQDYSEEDLMSQQLMMPDRQQQQQQCSIGDNTWGSSKQQQAAASASDRNATEVAEQCDADTADVDSASGSASEEYDADFEEYVEPDEGDGEDGAAAAAEVLQRARIMQSVAEISRSFGSASLGSDGTLQGTSALSSTMQVAPADSIRATAGSNTGAASPPAQPSTTVKQPELQGCKAVLGASFSAVYDYLLNVHRGAAAGGAAVRPTEVKQCLMDMVGPDKAKLEACFSLEQIVFRAVLTS